MIESRRGSIPRLMLKELSAGKLAGICRASRSRVAKGEGRHISSFAESRVLKSS